MRTAGAVVIAAAGLATALTLMVIAVGASQAVQPYAYTGAAPYPQEDLAGIPDSRGLTTTPLLSGIVHDAAGTPLTGAPVVVMAWPSVTVRGSMQIGDEVTIQPVAKTATAADGSYAVRLATASGLGAYADPQTGIVDLMAYVGDRTQTSPFTFAVKVIGTGSSASLAAASPSTALTQTANFNISDGPELSTANGDRAEATVPWANVGPEPDQPAPSLTPEPADTPTPTPTYTPTTHPTDGCRTFQCPIPTPTSTSTIKPCRTFICPTQMASCTVKLLDKTQAPVVLAVQYSRSQAAKMDFTYTADATTTLGWGFSRTAKFGSYRTDGEHAQGSGVTLGFKDRFGEGIVLRTTTFNYGSYKYMCPPCTGCAPVVDYHLIPLGGASTPTGAQLGLTSLVPDPPSSKCTPIEGDGELTLKKSTAITWSDGVNLSTKYGGYFSSRSGYTTDASLYYKNRAPKNKLICGTNDPPGLNPRVLVFK